jgi:mannose-6-phosphate isomerase-like protein (cupin superfamily)
MSDFYSQWLERSKKNEEIVNDAPRVMRSKDLKWVRTRQDHKAALMIAPELGFPTGGSCLMRAEIPVGWHTGKHLHGEEAIYVESGEGFMVLDDKRYDFFPGTVLHIDPNISCLILGKAPWAICRA